MSERPRPEDGGKGAAGVPERTRQALDALVRQVLPIREESGGVVAGHAPAPFSEHPSGARTARLIEQVVDRVVGSDPGLLRLVTALRAAAGIALVLAAEWLYVRGTEILQQPTTGLGGATLAAARAGNHQMLITAMLIGAMGAFLTGISVNDPTRRGQLAGLIFVGGYLVLGLSIGMLLGRHRVVALSSFTVLLMFGGWLRRFGPRGSIGAMLMYQGDFVGMTLAPTLALHDLYWLVSEVGVALGALAVVRAGPVLPHPAAELARAQRSYVARARRIGRCALELFEEGDEAARHRLDREIARLNEAALMIDARLRAGDDGVSARLHQRLFDAELALVNLARFSEALAHADLRPDRRAEVREMLRALVEGDLAASHRSATSLRTNVRELSRSDLRMEPGRSIDAGAVGAGTTVLLRRLAGCVIELGEALEEWLSIGRGEPVETPTRAIASPVTLEQGWLAGSSGVTARAAMGSGSHPLSPSSRVAIQLGVAVAVSTVLGDILDPSRAYWAVLAAAISFVGVNTAAEQVRKAGFRVLGTLVGIAAGSGLVELIGRDTSWTVVTVVVFASAAVYVFRVNYTMTVVGVTVVISLLYVQFDEFSQGLLATRLAETTLGAVVAVAVGLLVVPQRTRRVVELALAEQLDAITRLVTDVGATMGAHGRPEQLQLDARSLDAAQHVLSVSVEPLRSLALGTSNRRLLRLAAAGSAARDYTRNTVADALVASGEESPPFLALGISVLTGSLEVLSQACRGTIGTPYARAASLFDLSEQAADPQVLSEPIVLLLRDLQLLEAVG